MRKWVMPSCADRWRRVRKYFPLVSEKAFHTRVIRPCIMEFSNPRIKQVFCFVRKKTYKIVCLSNRFFCFLCVFHSVCEPHLTHRRRKMADASNQTASSSFDDENESHKVQNSTLEYEIYSFN